MSHQGGHVNRDNDDANSMAIDGDIFVDANDGSTTHHDNDNIDSHMENNAASTSTSTSTSTYNFSATARSAAATTTTPMTTAATASTSTSTATAATATTTRRRGPITTLVSAVTSFRLDNNNENTSSSSSLANAANNNNQEVDAALVKRKAIQSIMRDKSLTDLERRLRIQQLMDGSSKAASSSSSGGDDGAGGICTIIGRSSSRNNSGLPLLFGSGGGGATNNSVNNNTGTLSSTSFASSGGGAVGANQEVVACVHYERKCNIVAPCCKLVFGCRVCHDEMSGAYCGQTMDRFAIREVVCKECHTRQDSKTNKCIKCGVKFAQYHCPKCNIWMALDKRPFHCDQCGFCRVGGRENFRHCVQCCMCISTSVYDTHSCMEDKYKNNCPVCREDMFSSRQSPQDLPCGHAIHAHCFRNLAGFDYRCPICKKTVVSRASMSAAWSERARDIEMQPMPEDLARVVSIMCNDCERKSENCNWHFLGVQCPECSSFNTVVENMASGNAMSNR